MHDAGLRCPVSRFQYKLQESREWPVFCANKSKQTAWAPHKIWALKAPIQWAPRFLLRTVHPGTTAMTDFRRGLRPRVLTRHPGDRWAIHVISCSDEHEVIVTGRLANTAILKRFEHLSSNDNRAKKGQKIYIKIWTVPQYISSGMDHRTSTSRVTVVCVAL